MHDRKGLAAALNLVPVQIYTRNVFRSVELDALLSFIPPQPLFDLGPASGGQRFTPIGGPPALYVSEHPATSYFEANQLFASVAATARQEAPPTVILNLSVHIETVLDLTVPQIQQSLGTTLTELTGDWQWQMTIGGTVPTHMLAELAHLSGRFQAIRFPSSVENTVANLIIWTDRLVDPSFVQVNDRSGRLAQRIPYH